MPRKLVPVFCLLAVVFLDGCVSRRVEVLRGSRRKYPAASYWNVYAAAQNLLQRDGFIVNLNQQGRGILVATMVKDKKQSRVLDNISAMSGSSFHDGDQLHVMVTVSSLAKNKAAEMRLSFLRERENEWLQEDGDEIGNFELYEDFFKRVDKVVGVAAAPPKKDAGKSKSPAGKNPPG